MVHMAQTSAVLPRLGTVLAATAGLLLAGAPAHAAVHQHGDAYGDTSVKGAAGKAAAAAGASARAAAPAAASAAASAMDGDIGDITSLVVAHQVETVDVLVSMADLRPAGDLVAVRVRLETPSGSWTVRVADVRRGAAFHRVVKMRTQGSRGAAGCEQLSASTDYELDSITVRVPRTCLGGDPAWVRVGATSRLVDGGRVQLDDAQQDGRAPRRTTLSPRIVA